MDVHLNDDLARDPDAAKIARHAIAVLKDEGREISLEAVRSILRDVLGPDDRRLILADRAIWPAVEHLLRRDAEHASIAAAEALEAIEALVAAPREERRARINGLVLDYVSAVDVLRRRVRDRGRIPEPVRLAKYAADFSVFLGVMAAMESRDVLETDHVYEAGLVFRDGLVRSLLATATAPDPGRPEPVPGWLFDPDLVAEQLREGWTFFVERAVEAGHLSEDEGRELSDGLESHMTPGACVGCLPIRMPLATPPSTDGTRHS